MLVRQMYISNYIGSLYQKTPTFHIPDDQDKKRLQGWSIDDPTRIGDFVGWFGVDLLSLLGDLVLCGFIGFSFTRVI